MKREIWLLLKVFYLIFQDWFSSAKTNFFILVFVENTLVNIYLALDLKDSKSDRWLRRTIFVYHLYVLLQGVLISYFVFMLSIFLRLLSWSEVKTECWVIPLHLPLTHLVTSQFFPYCFGFTSVKFIYFQSRETVPHSPSMGYNVSSIYTCRFNYWLNQVRSVGVDFHVPSWLRLGF